MTTHNARILQLSGWDQTLSRPSTALAVGRKRLVSSTRIGNNSTQAQFLALARQRLAFFSNTTFHPNKNLDHDHDNDNLETAHDRGHLLQPECFSHPASRRRPRSRNPRVGRPENIPNFMASKSHRCAGKSFGGTAAFRLRASSARDCP